MTWGERDLIASCAYGCFEIYEVYVVAGVVVLEALLT